MIYNKSYFFENKLIFFNHILGEIIMIRTIKMLFLPLLICVTFIGTLLGQTKDPATLSGEELLKIEKSLKMDNYARAMMNAVSNNDMKKLALNRELMGKIDHHFAHRIETAGVTNQKSSGRCWLFTALNVIRPKVLKKYHLKDFEFSENYLFFWDQLEKANLFLESIIATRKKKIDDREVEWLFKNAIGDGGVWNMMVSLIKKYGIVPKEAMLESFNSDNTRMMSRLIRRKLREGGFTLRDMHKNGKNIKQLRGKKSEILTQVYRMLVICLGEPPKEFTWRYKDKDGNLSKEKKYTPIEFYQEVVKIDLDDYVMMMNDPSKEYFKLYEIKYDRNVYDSPNWTFVNLPIQEIKQFAKKSILADEPMYFSCDVGKQLNTKDGFLALSMYDFESMLGVKFTMNKSQRILTFDSGSTHGMALMGVDTSETGETTKWLLENSWGKEKGDEGYLTMTDDWMDAYMFRIVVPKQFVSEDVLKVLEQKPVKLPPWDPMF